MSFQINNIGEYLIDISYQNQSSKFYRLLKLYLENNRLENVNDIIVTKNSIGVFYQQGSEIQHSNLIDLLDNFKADFEEETTSIFEIPVCYENEFGIDLNNLIAHFNLTIEELIKEHHSNTYEVSMYGFIPGFSYLDGLSSKLNLPRKKTPIVRVPKGSIAIAENMSGIYPFETPGGWHIIGRTPLKMYDPKRDDPFLLKVGQKVNFIPISKNEYRQLNHD